MSLATIRAGLERIETAIVDGTWEDISDAWVPPTAELTPSETREASELLERIEAARDEVARLQAESTDTQRSHDMLRRAGRAYLRNDLPIT